MKSIIGYFIVFLEMLFLGQNCAQIDGSFQSLDQSVNGNFSQGTFSSRVGQSDQIWLGPMPFGQDDESRGWPVPTLRSGYPQILERFDPRLQVESKAGVFKLYVMILPTEVSSDQELKELIQSIEQRRMLVAVEVGGFRTSQHCGRGAGLAAAKEEFKLLNRWIDLGGRIDFLSTDHSIMSSMATPMLGEGLGGTRCQMSLDAVIREQIEYIAYAQRQLPNARIGVIESLGYFNFTSPQRLIPELTKTYETSDPRLPGWDLAEILTSIQGGLRDRGVTLDHFHIDYSLEGVEHDGRAPGGMRIGSNDFGRIALATRIAQNLGLRVGVIVNADGTSSRQASDRTLQYFEELRQWNGLRYDHVVLQTWFNYPASVGSGAEPHSAVGLMQSLLHRLSGAGLTPPPCQFAYSAWGSCDGGGVQERRALSASPHNCQGTPALTRSCVMREESSSVEDRAPSGQAPSLPQCQFRYSSWSSCSPQGLQTRSLTTTPDGPCTGEPLLRRACEYQVSQPVGIFRYGPAAIFYANASGRYCLYDDWERFKAATGVTDASTLPQVSSIPDQLVFDGICQY